MKIFYHGEQAVSYRGHVIVPGENDLPEDVVRRLEGRAGFKKAGRPRKVSDGDES